MHIIKNVVLLLMLTTTATIESQEDVEVHRTTSESSGNEDTHNILTGKFSGYAKYSDNETNLDINQKNKAKCTKGNNYANCSEKNSTNEQAFSATGSHQSNEDRSNSFNDTTLFGKILRWKNQTKRKYNLLKGSDDLTLEKLLNNFPKNSYASTTTNMPDIREKESYPINEVTKSYPDNDENVQTAFKNNSIFNKEVLNSTTSTEQLNKTILDISTTERNQYKNPFAKNQIETPYSSNNEQLNTPFEMNNESTSKKEYGTYNHEEEVNQNLSKTINTEYTPHTYPVGNNETQTNVYGDDEISSRSIKWFNEPTKNKPLSEDTSNAPPSSDLNFPSLINILSWIITPSISQVVLPKMAVKKSPPTENTGKKGSLQQEQFFFPICEDPPCYYLLCPEPCSCPKFCQKYKRPPCKCCPKCIEI